MAWERKGLLFNTEKNFPWMVSHASFPTALVIDKKLRVYFSCRSEEGKSLMTFLDFSTEDLSNIIYIHDKPLLDIGVPGAFDDSGTQSQWVMKNGNEIWLYYLGYNLGVVVPARNNTGLAVSADGGVTFKRMFQGPVLDRTPTEPFFAYTPSILKEDNMFHCWYGSGLGWEKVGEKMEGKFQIKYAKSVDGINWERANHTCLPESSPGEVNCRPSVLKDGDTYKMWFSFRGIQDFRSGSDGYAIGYAESKDKLNWTRKDEIGGLVRSGTGFDSEMVCFAQVLDLGSRRIILYNGNGFGGTGFGYAEWVD